jgi:Ca2+-binding RTX toxin-like protein
MIGTQSLQTVQNQLAHFATQSNFDTIMATAFGTHLDRAKLNVLRQQWLSGNFSIIPNIQVLSQGELGGANGAYAASLDRIFVSSDFLARASDSQVAALILEEVGHRIDQLLNNGVDSAGDEGEIFGRLVNGETLSSTTLAVLKAENDHGVIMVGGVAVAIEKQTLYGNNLLSDSLVGGTGNDELHGGETTGFDIGNDTLEGLGGDDFLDGEGGNDELNGGDGIDTLYGSVGDDSLYGGADNDSIYGGIGNDYIEGGDGIDYIEGDLGDDVIRGEGGEDYILAGFGNDYLAGNTGNDFLYGAEDNDTLIGGEGNDLLDGWTGDDDIFGDPGDDTIYGNDGNDNMSGGSGKDDITGGFGDDYLDGGADRDYLFGEEGNDELNGGDSYDSLDGGIGADTMLGGTGGDVYVVDNIGDVIIENSYEGPDIVNSSISYILGNALENLVLLNALNLSGTGNNLNNKITGNAGVNTLNGKAGNDTLIGANGTDVYVIDADVDLGSDTVIETVTGGVDYLDFRTTTTKAITVNLATVTSQVIATGVSLTLSSGSILPVNTIEYAYGGALGDNITGNSLNNLFFGGAGNDTLSGGVGLDTIYGDAGNDSLIGGVGVDRFSFAAILTGVNTVATALGRDTIADFGVNVDKIALSKSGFGLSAALGAAIAATDLLVVANDAAITTQTAKIIFSQGSGNLFYNADGAANGLGVNGGNFAVLTGVTNVLTSDFVMIA